MFHLLSCVIFQLRDSIQKLCLYFSFFWEGKPWSGSFSQHLQLSATPLKPCETNDMLPVNIVTEIYPSSASLDSFICKSSSFELRTRCAEFPVCLWKWSFSLAASSSTISNGNISFAWVKKTNHVHIHLHPDACKTPTDSRLHVPPKTAICRPRTQKIITSRTDKLLEYINSSLLCCN